MIFDDPSAFLKHALRLGADRPAFPRAAFLVAPDGLRLAAESAQDNRYMDAAQRIAPERALLQHRALHQALAERLPTVLFPGRTETPDAVFPNNVFATARVEGEPDGRFIVGHMRHPGRQREAERADIDGFFTGLLGYRRIDLRGLSGWSELTGTLVIDRARGLGFAGLGPRCDRAGVQAMHAAFGLRATLAFELAADEYHSNVVMSVLGGRALVLAPDGLAEQAVADALCALYRPALVLLDRAERQGFAGNCIALDPGVLWMSERARDALRESTRHALHHAGWRPAVVPLDEIEKAGGSLRCCVAEIF